MTNDELLTRLHRVEAQIEMQQAWLLALLPAIPQEGRHQAMRQFHHFCKGLDQTMASAGLEPAVAQLQRDAAADLYVRIEGALELIAEHERKKKKS